MSGIEKLWEFDRFKLFVLNIAGLQQFVPYIKSLHLTTWGAPLGGAEYRIYNTDTKMYFYIYKEYMHVVKKDFESTLTPVEKALLGIE